MNCGRHIFAGPVQKEPELAGRIVDVTRKGRGRLTSYVLGERMRSKSSDNRQVETRNHQIGCPHVTEVTMEVMQILGALDGKGRFVRGGGRS